MRYEHPLTIANRLRRAADTLALASAFVALSVGIGGCRANNSSLKTGEETVEQRPIEEVLQEHTPEWMTIPGVVGTAIGACDGEPCITILLARESPEARERIPAVVEGHRVDFRLTGPIEAREEPDTPQAN